METEVIEQPVKTEEAKADSGQVKQETKYANDGAEGLDAFMSDNVGPDYLEKVSERQEVKEPKKEEQPTEEEGKKEEPTVDKETQEKIDGLLAKAEDGELSEEEIAFMKEQGYEVEEEESEEKPADEKKKEEEKPVELKLPEEFTSELDDFFGDDENYDPEKLTAEDRLKYASKAIKVLRGNQSKLQQVFDSSPEVAGFISDIVKGVDPRKAIKNNMPELIEADQAPDPSKDKEAYDQWVIDQHNAKLERKRIKDLQKTQQDNLQKSIQDAQEFVLEKKLTDKKKQEKFFGELDKHLQNVARHHVSKELMELVYKGMNYDDDVSSAERAGEVKGMNKKIKFKKRTGDGLVRIRTAKKDEPKRGVVYKDEGAEGLDKFLNGNRQ